MPRHGGGIERCPLGRCIGPDVNSAWHSHHSLFSEHILRSILRLALTALVASTPAAACGTAVYSHKVEVTVSDPTHRLPPPPYEVGFFDWRMGTSQDFALKSAGKATDSTPFTTTSSTMATVLVFSGPRPDSLELSVALPALTTNGFFHLWFHPTAVPAGDVQAGYQLYEGSVPAGDGPKLNYRYSAEPLDKGWRLKIALLIPPA